jgi:hypothetical protein
MDSNNKKRKPLKKAVKRKKIKKKVKKGKQSQITQHFLPQESIS